MSNQVGALRESLSACVSKKTLQLCEYVLEMPEFSYFPASMTKHHSYIGGLAAHTREAWEAAKGIYQASEEELIDVVATGVVFHDVGKLSCYKEHVAPTPIGSPDKKFKAGQPDDYGRFTFSKTEEYYDSYHIVLSYEMFKQKSKGMSGEFIRRVSHCILAHHGQQSAGSPVTPTTKEAWAVYLGDVASVTVMSSVYPKHRDFGLVRISE